MERVKVGIDKIGMYVPKEYIDLRELAEFRGVDPNKWVIGLGQEKMAIVPNDQDIVSMGANACNSILDDSDKQAIDQIIFATESGIDYSKSAATYIHELLNIQAFARSYEMKQACYSATAALQTACDYVRLRPDRKVLVVSSDISKYGLQSSGESSGGAGAVAILVSANPRILEILDYSVSLTFNSFDFWRPNYCDYPIVEGKYSTNLYVEIFMKIFGEFYKRYPKEVKSLDVVLFHLPFSKMGKKALKKLSDLIEEGEDERIKEERLKILNKWIRNYDITTLYSKQIGNIYTGSLYMGLISFLLNKNDIKEGDKIGFYSYGSGSVAELFMGKFSLGFEKYLNLDRFTNHLARRKKISVDEYEKNYYRYSVNRKEDIDFTKDDHESGFYIKKVVDHKRFYGKK